jgi:hypothetical protein
MDYWLFGLSNIVCWMATNEKGRKVCRIPLACKASYIHSGSCDSNSSKLERYSSTNRALAAMLSAWALKILGFTRFLRTYCRKPRLFPPKKWRRLQLNILNIHSGRVRCCPMADFPLHFSSPAIPSSWSHSHHWSQR